MMNLLAINMGSATLKFRIFGMMEDDIEEEETAASLAGGLVEFSGSGPAELTFDVRNGPLERSTVQVRTHGEAVESVIGRLRSHPETARLQIDGAGHRIVHGGTRFSGPTRITPDTLSALRELSPLAPLHNPSGIAGIEAGLRLLPNTPAVAVFDTTFHTTLPPVAATYALPRSLRNAHSLRRYGFHGLSHRSVSEKLLELLERPAAGTRLITCHLGSGASLCALRDGKSVDTSMGFTPMEGLVMGTRCGDLDPGLLLYLLNTVGLEARELEDLLTHDSGLRGVSGLSDDVRVLERAAEAGDPDAELALALFAYRVRKYIGAYTAALGGLDALAFTGGIGVHSNAMRRRICRNMEFFGILLAEEAPNTGDTGTPIRISAADASVPIWTVPTDEELQIARETRHVLRSESPATAPV